MPGNATSICPSIISLRAWRQTGPDWLWKQGEARLTSAAVIVLVAVVHAVFHTEYKGFKLSLCL